MSSSQKTPRYNIAVAGAGIAGLAAASFLKQAGHDVTVFERAQTLRPAGAGLLLQPTGLACLEKLGLKEEVLAASMKIDRLYGTTPSGKTVFDLRHGRLEAGMHSAGVHRNTLFTALLGKARSLHIPFVTGFDAAETIQDQTSIRLRAADGGLTQGFDLAVDASGVHSKLRPAQGASVTPFPYASLWAIVRDETGVFSPTTLTQRFDGARKMSGVLPVGGDKVAFFWSVPADEAAWRGSDFTAFKKEVADLWPETAPLLAQMKTHTDLTYSTYSDTVLKRHSDGRLVFIGDAAHSTSPQLGNGGNLALGDAMQLAGSLETSANYGDAFAAYQQARRGTHRFYQGASRLLTPYFQSDSTVKGFLRDSFMPVATRLPGIERETLLALTGMKTGLLTHRSPKSFRKPG